MLSENSVIRVDRLSKCYHIYATPRDRIKQMVFPVLHKVYKSLTDGPASVKDGGYRYFSEFWALQDISFQVKRGEAVGIIGRNGSGKSTLLQIICGTQTQTTGTAQAGGRISALLELGSGFDPAYTGRENIFFNGQILGLTRKEIQTKLESIINFADIGNYIDQPVRTYSSGMVVRLAFAVASHIEPNILVIDEALAVGDSGFQARCYARINELRRRGVTLLFVSHSMNTVAQICDRVLLLDKGELLLEGPPGQTINAYNYLAGCSRANYPAVRKDIMSMAQKGQVKTKSHLVRSCPTVMSSQSTDDRTGLESAYLDEKLLTLVTPIYLSQHGASIQSVRILDLMGAPVNVLPLHHEFVLCFEVAFENKCGPVRFSWVIRTLKGTILSGGASHRPGRGVNVNNQETIEIRSRFTNIFLPGEYLVDVGVKGWQEDTDEFMHGINQALCVRSVTNNATHRHGHVDCLVQPLFEITQKPYTCP